MTSADWASIGIGVVAVLIALSAYVNNRSFQTREALGKLLESYERAGWHTLMWRVEQLTRPSEGTNWSTAPVTPTELRKRLEGDRRDLLDRALADDWSVPEAHMHNVYFFALRVQAWVAAGWMRRHRTRLANDAFGYSLLSTLLDHHIVALRLRRDDQPESYFPTFYGLFDREYSDLVRQLARDILVKRRNQYPGPVRKVLTNKQQAIDEGLAGMSPEDSAMLALTDDGS